MCESSPRCNSVYPYTLAFQPLVHVCAKNLVAFVSQEAGNKPVLLAMALKDKTVEGIQALREVIRSCQVW
nr:PREDICTED: proteasome assembly chaperone 3 [Struthio camelus australis]